jgi:TIR domain
VQSAGQAVEKVFIGYSHDTFEHSERVLALSNQLRSLGVEVELDRYHVRPPQGWPHWCEEQLRPEISSFVLVICTPTYRARIEKRVGADEGRGVYWEGAILYNYLYNAKANSRFIPVLLDDATDAAIPMPLDGHTRYRLRAFELADPDFEALYRELTSQPETPKPTLGDVIKLNALGGPIVAKPLPDKEAVTNFRSVASFWSPFSDEESVDRGEVRFWAIVETLAAMTAFWWFAINYETFLLLTTGLFIAPLLLLRSDESTRLGVRWIDTGMFPPRRENVPSARAEDERSLWRLLGIGAAVGMAVGFALGYPRATFDLLGRDWIVEAAEAVVAIAAVGALASAALETAGFGAVV